MAINYLKSALKVLGDYFIIMLIFVFFSYPFFKHLRGYSFVVFILMFLLIYSDMNKLGIKEKRPQYDLKPYPLKGLVLGLIGFLPLILLVLVSPLINIQTSVVNFANLKHLALNALLGPLFFLIKLGNEAFSAYILSSLVVPVIAMLGYLSGYYGFEASAFFRRFKKVNPSKPDIRRR